MKTQKIYIEHLNLTVNNIDESVHFFQTAFPNFKIRGGDKNLKEWLHIGDDYTYIAIEQTKSKTKDKTQKNYDKIGVNHLAYVVQNIDKITERLEKNGYKRSYPKSIEKFRIRDYFFDADGNEFEFVEYLSDVIEERNMFD